MSVSCSPLTRTRSLIPSFPVFPLFFSDQKNPQASPSHVAVFHMGIPLDANSVYYRDELGNISTSMVRALSGANGLTGLTVELFPRYPLFGGWQISFQTGYRLPLTSARLAPWTDCPPSDPQSSCSDRYQLNLSFCPEFVDATIDQYELRIQLPYGARQISVVPPFPVDQIQVLHTEEQSESSLPSSHQRSGWLWWGALVPERLPPTVVLRRSDVVSELGRPLLIRYQLPYWAPLWSNPWLPWLFAVCSVLLTAVYACCCGLGRADSASEQTDSWTTDAAALAARWTQRSAELDRLFSRCVKARDFARFQQESQPLRVEMHRLQERIAQLGAESSAAAGPPASPSTTSEERTVALSAIGELLRRRAAQQQQLHQLERSVTDLVLRDPDQYRAERQRLDTALQDADEQLIRLLDALQLAHS
jgi:hypothetical protein